MLAQKKVELESLLQEAESRAEEIEELNHALSAEKGKLQSVIQSLEDQ